MNSFGNRLRQARIVAKLSQATLGKKVGLSQSVISDLESGAQAETALNVQLAVACAVDPVWLVMGLGNATPDETDIVPIWNQLAVDRQGRLLAYAQDLLVAQKAAPN